MLPNTKRWNSHVSHVDSISAGKEQCIELRDKTSLALAKREYTTRLDILSQHINAYRITKVFVQSNPLVHT